MSSYNKQKDILKEVHIARRAMDRWIEHNLVAFKENLEAIFCE